MRHLVRLSILILAAGLSLAATVAAGAAPSIRLLGRTYELGSFDDKATALWEFVEKPETVDNWTRLVTVIDRPDATSFAQLDQLAEGIMSNYRSHQAQILLAHTERDTSGHPFNYIVAAFNEVAPHRFELDFVKVGLGRRNAYAEIYSVRVTGATDATDAASFLSKHSKEIGNALAAAPAPPIDQLPRTPFSPNGAREE